MKKSQVWLTIFALLIVWFVATPVQAVCDSDFASLINAIQNADFKNSKDRDALLLKANTAQLKANRGKTADAITKLNAIISKTNLLISNGKIRSGGDAILNSASSTLNCLN